MRYVRLAVFLPAALALTTVFPAGYLGRASAATYTVDSTGDASDSSTADGVCDTDGSVGPHTISPGSLVVELDGSGAGGADGLKITAGSSRVKGLVINRFSSDGIELATSGNNTIQGNYIGTDVSGTAKLEPLHAAGEAELKRGVRRET